jgi:hypothetical protein
MFNKVASFLILIAFSHQSLACCGCFIKKRQRKVMARIAGGSFRENPPVEARAERRTIFALNHSEDFLKKLYKLAHKQRLMNLFWEENRRYSHEFFSGEEVVTLTKEILETEQDRSKIAEAYDFFTWSIEDRFLDPYLKGELGLLNAHLHSSLFHTCPTDSPSQEFCVMSSPKREDQEMQFLKI